MGVLENRVVAVCCLGLIAAVIGFGTPVPSSAQTPSTDDFAVESVRPALASAASSPGPLTLSVPGTCSGDESLSQSESDRATSPAPAVTCVRIWLTPRSPYLCCAGAGFMRCQATR